MSELGEMIRKLRKQQGMSLKALANAVGVSEQSLVSIEQGKTKQPNFYLIAAIADELGISLDTLRGKKTMIFTEQEIAQLQKNLPFLQNLHRVLSLLLEKLPHNPA